MRSFFDTNILVYLFDEDAPEKKARAQALVQAETAEGRLLISTQVLQEFYVAVTRKLAAPLPAEAAEHAVRDLATLPLVQVDAPLVLAAVRREREDGFSFWDALILEAALAGGSTCLFSEDLQHGRVVRDLRIENPFA